MDVAAIDDQIVRHPMEAGLREGAVAERQDVAGAVPVRPEFEEHDRPVMAPAAVRSAGAASGD